MSDTVAGTAPLQADASVPRQLLRSTPADSPRIPLQQVGDAARQKILPGPKAEAVPPLSTEELAQMLRRINLTFDLFEVAAKYEIDESDGMIRVTLINTHTGEVIRRIPPTDFKSSFNSFREGLGLLVNRLL